MDKYDFLLTALGAGKYLKKKWLLRAFSLVQETKTKELSQDWDIIQTAAGFLYKDPNTGDLEKLTGNIKPGQPLFTAQDPIQIKKGQLPGVLKDEMTTVGRLLWHCIVFVYPFGPKVAFANRQLNMGKFEDDLATRLRDEPPHTELYENKYFYPSELQRYYEAMAYARGLAMLFVPAASIKSMKIDPAIIKRRDELFADPNIDMSNPAVAASVEKELVDMDRNSFKGDTASGFLISKKDFPIIRKKRFISFGSADSMIPGERTPYVKRSLDEGIDIHQFKAYNDEMRTGSYKRGVETMYGGELDKWMVRESSNIRVQLQDCGSLVGIPTPITDLNKTQWLGYNIVNGKSALLLTEDNIGTYLGKTVMRRTPAACLAPAPDYCAFCLGQKLSMNPDAISIAFSQYGHDFMGISMSAMHGTTLAVARMDLFSEAL